MREIVLLKADGGSLTVKIYQLAEVGDRDGATGEVPLIFQNGRRLVVICSVQDYASLTAAFTDVESDRTDREQTINQRRQAKRGEPRLQSGLTKRESFVLAAISGGRDLTWAETEADKFIQEYDT